MNLYWPAWPITDTARSVMPKHDIGCNVFRNRRAHGPRHYHEIKEAPACANALTQAIVDLAKPLGIEVHDHPTVGQDGHASFKALRLI